MTNRSPRKRHFRSVSIYWLLPNMLTIGGFVSGLTALRFALDGRWAGVIVLVTVAAVFDALDGRAARRLKTQSAFGAALDSLSDLVVFGVVPTLCLFIWALQDSGNIAWVATLFFAASYILAKKLSSTESTLEILVALNFIVTITLAPFAVVFWVTPSLHEVLFLSIVALFATAGHLTMTMALKLAPITITQPISYVQIVWASCIGFIFFGETISLWFSIGASLIILSSLYVTYTSSSKKNKDINNLVAKD